MPFSNNVLLFLDDYFYTLLDADLSADLESRYLARRTAALGRR